MQTKFNEQELLHIINNHSKLFGLFQDQNSKYSQVIILIGVTGAGKSTLFNFLSGAEFEMNGPESRQNLCIKDKSERFSIIKGGLKSVTKSPNYYFSHQSNSLLIDFPGFQDTDGKIDQVLTQLLFYQIVKSANVRIVYVIKHLENQFNNRGTSLQQFISQTFQGENFDISQICLMLNCYNDNLTDENLITNVQSQLERIYNCRPQNICVMRKISKNQDIEQILTPQKRNYLFQQFLKSNPVLISLKYVPNCEKIGLQLSEKSEQILDQLCSTLENNLNDNLEKLTCEQVNNLEQSLKQISLFLNNQKKDMVNWFQELINYFVKSISLLNFQNQKCQDYSNFMTILSFFAQLSEFIPGYEDIKNNCKIAQEKCENIIRIIKGKLDLIQKQQDLLKVEKEKMKESQLRLRADENSQKQSQLAQQASQNLSQHLIVYQNTQNDLNKERQEKFEIQTQQQILIQQFQQQQDENQRIEKDKINMKNTLETENLRYQSRIQEVDKQNQDNSTELKQISQTLSNVQTQNQAENEKLEKMLNDMLSEHKELAKLVQEELIKKDELMQLIQDCRNDQGELEKKIRELACRIRSSCQLI
ncbi:unnamed protein product (macronuclear) [Paramecium tetraurelia]|uniref:G domain-containing protein n=1 Tax=Paramecium tetraurelia TaxID=5888 RepID=A0E3F2_PARTE|nr:uncharacterized protein GSPATT00022992001 [Paramecium tetraurelia]CAK89819.1 unnamed protein product [Paramecium tetraurelia]|eukprot:XP_001457216.1 hypothetical protein (macronuclear) [Paramecium tetraurelia strain d4-2]